MTNADPIATRRGPDAARARRSTALLGFLAAYTVWCSLPSLLSLRIAPADAALATFAAVACALLATRERHGSRSGLPRRLAALCLAACAGALAQPAWLRAVARVGLLLGLAPIAPAPATPFAASPSLWLAAGAAAPLAEELLYRERLLLALRGAGPAFAVGASSLLFALPHLEPWWILGALLLGLWLGALAWTSRRLSLCVGYHAGINVACLAAGATIRPRDLCAAALAASCAALLAALCALRAPRRACAAAAALGALLLGASASAEVFDFEAELVLDPIAPGLPSARIEGVGVAMLDGSGGGPSLETLVLDGGLAGTATVPVTDPLVSNAGLTALRLRARLGAGALRPFHPPATWFEPQLTNGRLPIHGSVRLCMLVSCSFGLDLPLDAATQNGTIGLGVGGLISVNPLATLRRSVIGAPWTPGSATLVVPTPAGGQLGAFDGGFAHGPLSFTGSTARTGGTLQLVTPFVVESPGGIDVPSGFARLRLRFVPEPTSLFVLAPSFALLAAGARRRSRRGGST